MSGQRLRQIDILKGLAIIGVMVQHAFTGPVLDRSWEILYAGQAVPIFFVLMGLNAFRSLGRGGDLSLKDLYTRRYAISRFDRLLVPFLLLWPAAVLAALAAGILHLGPLVLIGGLPMTSAPGNYFVTIVLEFAVVFPLVFWCFQRAPVITTVVLVVADIGFELIAPHIAIFGSTGVGHGYLYEAAIVKYASAIVAGMWLGRVRIGRAGGVILTLLALMSVAYLVVLHEVPADFEWLEPSFSESTNFLSVFYAVWLTWLGLHLLSPRPWLGMYSVLERLGRASYHIFLVQIVWFGVLTDRSWPAAVAGMIACSLIGYAYFVALPSISARKPRVRPASGAASG